MYFFIRQFVLYGISKHNLSILICQVEFSEPSLHYLAPGDLDDEEIDDVIAYLDQRCASQENIELSQLQGSNFLS